MKILFLISSLNIGGAERVAVTLCNAWVDRGDEVTLVPTFSQASTSSYQIDSRVDVIYLANIIQSKTKNPFSYIKRLLAIRQLMRDKKPDVIISFLSNVNVAAILSSRLMNIPVICCERRNPRQSIGYLWETLCKITYPFSNMLLAQTQAVIPTMQKLHPCVKKIVAIANPVSNELINATQQWNTTPRKILLSLSRLVNEKQIDKTILTFSKLANLHSDWDLHIYGDGPIRNDLIHLINSLNLNNRIFLKGAIRNPWLTMADKPTIFISTSRFEGFPNTLLEAMAVGVPVIAFDCPYGPREASDNGRNAVLVPLDDLCALETKLSELMSNPSLQTTLSAQARNYVNSQYNIKNILSQWDALILEVINQQQGNLDI